MCGLEQNTKLNVFTKNDIGSLMLLFCNVQACFQSQTQPKLKPKINYDTAILHDIVIDFIGVDYILI